MLIKAAVLDKRAMTEKAIRSFHCSMKTAIWPKDYMATCTEWCGCHYSVYLYFFCVCVSVSLIHYFCCSLNVTDSFSFSAVVHQDKSGNKENLPCCLGDGVCLQTVHDLTWLVSQ